MSTTQRPPEPPEQDEEPATRPYRAPALTVHGKIAELTRSGKLVGLEGLMTGSQV